MKSANVDEIKAMPGVKQVLVVDDPKLWTNQQGAIDLTSILGGVAIVADSWWQAESARRKLKVVWDEGATATKKDKLVFGVAGDAKVLDPALASDGESFRVARQMFEGLVRPEEGGTKIVPSLAESWTPESAWTWDERGNSATEVLRRARGALRLEPTTPRPA